MVSFKMSDSENFPNTKGIEANVTIIGPVIIGEHALIGAGAVVTKDVEPRQVIAGVPAKPIGMTIEPNLLYK
jgi:acetyltransferase-like isoleucine patch superfamily enzyme